MKRKRISTTIAVVLLITLLSGLVAIPGMANTINYPPVGRVSDPPTDAQTPNEDQMGFMDVIRVHDGRIWTDKTVRNGSDVDDFNITLSALSQSFPLVSGYAIPTDTVFVIDVSGSMLLSDEEGGRTRIDILIEALNGAIDILQDAHLQNRIAVVAYGGGESGTGRARVEHLLPLGRYTAALGSNEYFSYIPTPTSQFRLQVNVGSNPRTIRVNASTPTQWGIYEGARILETATPKTAVVPLTSGDSVTDIIVTRRPNIVLMTDGEPTLGWSNYLFDPPPAPANPVTPGSTGALVESPVPPGAYPGVFYGDGSWGEMGVSLLTVLTAAHRKRLVLNSYFGGGGVGSAPPGYAGQPGASVGFFSIAFGKQPAGSAQSLIEATMNPGNFEPSNPNVNNADAVNWNVRNYMTDLFTSPYGPPIADGGVGNNTFKLNKNPPPPQVPDFSGESGNMGALLRAFAAPTPLPISFHVSRRQTYGSYLWDTTPLTINNTANLTLEEIDFADLFATPTNLEELNKVFRDITTNIQKQGIQKIVTAANPDDSSFDGYLSFSDVLGEYMQVRNVGNLFYNDTEFSRAGFASAIANNTTARNEYIDILLKHMNYGTEPTNQFYLSRATVADLVNSNIENTDFLTNNSLKYYANTNRDFIGNFFLPNGTPAPQPAGAAAVVEVFPMWGPMTAAPAPPSGQTDLRLITFHVITALRTAGFAELYATNNAGDPMMRILNTGDQMIRWYIPSDLIPIRTPEFDADGLLTGIAGNKVPIRVNFTVGLDRERVSAGIPQDVFTQYQVTGTTDQMYFYSNRHNPNPTNVTLAFFRPHQDNPFYKGVGGTDVRGVIKSQNLTQTAPHVSLNRLTAYSAEANYDMHWLGNNGRLTFRITPPPEPPALGDLTISKTFTGIPSDMDVFDTDIVSQISFLVIGTNAAGTEIYRETVFFNSTDFRWNDALRRYEFTLRDLPFGNYRVYERGGNILNYVVARPGPPQLVSITSTGQQVEVNFINNYTPTPIEPEELPALTIWKVFHGLTNAEIPSDFQIRITGPRDFSQTISSAQAIARMTFKNLATGSYTVTEANNNVPGFNLVVSIDNESVTLPYTFTIENASEHIAITIDNEYTPIPPPTPSPPPPSPSPQTGLRDFTIPIVIFILGAALVGAAEFYRRKGKKKPPDNL